MNCPKCGKDRKTEDHECTYCGVIFKKLNMPATPSKPRPKPSPKEDNQEKEKSHDGLSEDEKKKNYEEVKLKVETEKKEKKRFLGKPIPKGQMVFLIIFILIFMYFSISSKLKDATSEKPQNTTSQLFPLSVK